MATSVVGLPEPILDTVSPPHRKPEQVPPSAERFDSWSRRYVGVLVFSDALIGAAAVLAPAMFSINLREGYLSAFLLPLTMLGAMLWPIAVSAMRGYLRSAIGVGSEELRSVLRAGVAIVVAGALPAGWLSNDTLLTLVVVAVPLAVLSSLTARLITRKALHRQQRQGRSVRRVVIVGSAQTSVELQERMAREPHGGMRVIGACVPADEKIQAREHGLTVLGDLNEVRLAVSEHGADAVAVTSGDATRYSFLRRLAWSLEGAGVELLVDPGLVEVAGPRMHIRPVMGFPLLHVEEPHFTGWRRALKRTVDLSVTSLGVVLISPLLFIIAAAVKLQDGGPVLFKQLRVGRGGELFTMYKFRSMVVDAEARKNALMARNQGKGGLFKLDHDPRVTRLGKFLRDFSLDELPQLVNVLNGSMSLVGPRPHLAEELAVMPHASRRSLVTPGLTGLWQVSGRSDLEGDDAIRLDLRYVENWTLTMDLLILWKTGAAVLARRGAR